eukprot:12049579-Karenia_brevis.AAC.1
MPWQQYRPCIQHIISHACVSAESRTRTVLIGLDNVDAPAFQMALRGLDQHQRNVITAVATLSTVDQSILHRFDPVETD